MSVSVKEAIFIAFSVATHIWILDRFFSSFFARKRLSFSSVLPWLLLFISQFMVQLSQLEPPAFFIMIQYALNLLIVIFSYESSQAGTEKYFLLMIFQIIWSLTELVFYMLFHIFQMEWETLRVIGTVLTTIFMMTFSYLVSVLWDKKNNEQIPRRFCFALLVIPAGSAYIMYVEYLHSGYNLLSLSVVGILFLFNVVIFDVYTRISRFFLREKENAVHAEQLSLIAQNIEEQKKLMDAFYEEKHNLINELTALQSSRGSSEETVRSLERILRKYHNIENISSTGNDVVDAIINAKYAAAREYGVSFRLHLCVPETLAVEPCDLGVVIGNALDNAIAAVRECSEEEKVITISMGVRKNAWIMVMKNSYAHEIRQNRNGEILSSKPDRERHGYGLRSIRRIAEAYAGDVIIETENHCFCLTVVLNLREEKPCLT